MASNGREKNAAQELKVRRFAAAVLEHGDIRKAARAGNVPERTAYRWAATEIFRAALREAQAEAMRDATQGLAAGAREAVDVLRVILKDGEAAESVRCRAAIAVLDAALKMQQYIEVDNRITELERLLCARN